MQNYLVSEKRYFPTEKYTERFIDAYGKDAIIPDMLKAVAAAEVFA